jgi:hypothetical protein
MEYFLEVLAESLRNAGLTVTHNYNALIVDGVPFTAYSYRRPHRIQWCGKYFPIHGRKFDVRAVVVATLLALPRRRREQEEQRRIHEEARTAAELKRILDEECTKQLSVYTGETRTVHATGPEVAPGVHVAYVGDGKFVTFMCTEDAGRALVAADYLSEMVEGHL